MSRGNDDATLWEIILYLVGIVCAIVLSLMIMFTAVAVLVKFMQWLDLFV